MSGYLFILQDVTPGRARSPNGDSSFASTKSSWHPSEVRNVHHSRKTSLLFRSRFSPDGFLGWGLARSCFHVRFEDVVARLCFLSLACSSRPCMPYPSTPRVPADTIHIFITLEPLRSGLVQPEFYRRWWSKPPRAAKSVAGSIASQQQHRRSISDKTLKVRHQRPS